jgi:hypothetical protein
MVGLTALMVALATPSFAQANDVYQLNYFSNAFIATGENGGGLEVYD